MKKVLQKYIADSGYCSRRSAEKLIKVGRVNVNKKTAPLGMRVDEKSVVTANGEIIKPQEDFLYIALNKPR